MFLFKNELKIQNQVDQFQGNIYYQNELSKLGKKKFKQINYVKK